MFVLGIIIITTLLLYCMPQCSALNKRYAIHVAVILNFCNSTSDWNVSSSSCRRRRAGSWRPTRGRGRRAATTTTAAAEALGMADPAVHIDPGRHLLRYHQLLPRTATASSESRRLSSHSWFQPFPSWTGDGGGVYVLCVCVGVWWGVG